MEAEIASSILRGRFSIVDLVLDILFLPRLSETRGIRIGILPYMRKHCVHMIVRCFVRFVPKLQNFVYPVCMCFIALNA